MDEESYPHMIAGVAGDQCDQIDGQKRRGQRAMSQAQTLVSIENWAVVENVLAQNYQELEPGNHLTGYVFGHATLPNATFIYTSPIVSIDRNKRLVETRNTIYQLGAISDEYEVWDNRRRA
jgi:hypothetical protein